MQNSFFQSNSIRLKHINYEANNDFIFETMVYETKVDTKVMRVNDQKNAKVEVDIVLFDNVDINEVPFKVSLGVEGIFSWDGEIEEQTLESLLKINAAAILYSYARPMLTQLTVFSGFPALILPILDFTKDKEKSE